MYDLTVNLITGVKEVDWPLFLTLTFWNFLKPPWGLVFKNTHCSWFLVSLCFSFISVQTRLVLNQKWKQQYKSQFNHWNLWHFKIFEASLGLGFRPLTLLLVWRLVKNWVAILTSQTNTETTCSNKNWENRRPAVTLEALYFESRVFLFCIGNTCTVQTRVSIHRVL